MHPSKRGNITLFRNYRQIYRIVTSRSFEIDIVDFSYVSSRIFEISSNDSHK